MISFANSGLRAFSSCGQYVQGPGAMAKLPAILATWPGRPIVLVDSGVQDLLRETYSWMDENEDFEIISFEGEITDTAISGLVQDLGETSATVVAAIGGGKALDAGKMVAVKLGLPVVTVPTIASTDAPASRGIALYDDAHRLEKVVQMRQNPVLVLVDTAIIATAPVDFLRAGIGDAIAKKFEAEAASAAGALNKHGTLFLRAGFLAAEGCYSILRSHGQGAIDAATNNVTNEDLEATVEACFLLSALGFENTGLSFAHSLTRGLVQTDGVSQALHGFHVAYGTLVQCAVENRSNRDLADLAGYLRAVGLPVSLTDMGANVVGDAVLDRIAALTMTSPHIQNLAHPVDQGTVRAALDRVEGQDYFSG